MQLLRMRHSRAAVVLGEADSVAEIVEKGLVNDERLEEGGVVDGPHEVLELPLGETDCPPKEAGDESSEGRLLPLEDGW